MANYSLSGALWLFPSTLSFNNAKQEDLDKRLAQSLGKVLERYPQWCGTLRLFDYVPPKGNGGGQVTDHTKRFGRVWIDWGQVDDPGVELITQSNKSPLASMMPHQLAEGIYDAGIVNADLYPSSRDFVNLRNPDPDQHPKPCMIIKITHFSDGGIGIAPALHHSLADAQTLSTFMRDWGTVYRGEPVPPRPFDPSILDAHADGEIDTPYEDDGIRMTVMDLSQRRYDFWAVDEDRPQPGFMSAPSAPDPAITALDEQSGKKRGRRIPWEQWEFTKPVKDYLFSFRPGQIQAIWEKVSDGDKGISRLDALLAHLWGIVVRARELPENTECSIDLSIGLRPRLSPPLPTTFLGSPIVNISSTLSSTTITSSPSICPFHPPSNVLNGCINRPALLHHYAHALDPIREWNAFMGNQNLLVTSWIGVGGYEIDFGPDLGRVGWVHGLMPGVDGLMAVMEAGPWDGVWRGGNEEEGTERDNGRMKDRRWYQDGVEVRMFLQEEVMERVLSDPRLFGDREG